MEAEEIYAGPGANATVTGSEDNIFSWIKDALFSKKESPSKRYLHPDGDTGMTSRRYRPTTITERNYPRVRSNSLDGLTESFYQRYDLLHDEEDATGPASHFYNDNIRPRSVDRAPQPIDHNGLRSPINIHPKLAQQRERLRTYAHRTENNDTFNKRDNIAEAELSYRSPRRGDPLLNRLFMGDRNPPVGPEGPIRFPGKFPTPTKPKVEATERMDTRQIVAYEELLSNLAANNNQLQSLNGTISAQQKEQESQEQFLRRQYLQIKDDYTRTLRETSQILDLSEMKNKENRRLREENERLRYENRNELEFEQQQVSSLKNELKQTTMTHQRETERLLRKLEDLRSENNRLAVENNNLRYDIETRDKAHRPRY